MILLRQKLYTRAEQAMWRELHKATNGYRRLPSGYKNMTPRDMYRLRNIMRANHKQLSKEEADFLIQKIKVMNRGKVPRELEEKIRNTRLDFKLNPEDIEVVAKHLGLPETAKTGAKVFEKYNNPELIERYKRIQRAQRDEYRRLCERRDSMEILSKAELDKIKSYEDKLWRAQERENQVYKFYDRQKALRKKAKAEAEAAMDNNPELSEKLQDYIRKKGITVKDKYNDIGHSLADPYKRTIILDQKDKYSPGAVMHEFGHLEAQGNIEKDLKDHDIFSTLLKEGGVSLRSGYTANPMYPLVNEYEASARALSRMKAGLATPKETAEAENFLTKAYQSRYHGSLGNIVLKAHDRLKV